MTGLRWNSGAAVALLILSFAAASPAAEKGPGTAGIAASHPLAVDVGRRILDQGGNAFDAAVAIAAALAVVEPYRSGLGGGAFYLLHDAESGRQVFVDAREVAPLAATANMYLDGNGQPVPGLSRSGALSAGIPGGVAGMVWINEKYGKLPLQTVLQPAIEFARNGFPAYRHFLLGLRPKLDLMRRWPAAPAVFFPDGVVPELGATIVQADLADTLEAIAEHGRDGFYQGEIAEELVEGVRAAGGIWSLEDLASYDVIERTPVYGQYHDMRIVSAPPPSAGGVALIDIFNQLAPYALEQDSRPEEVHLIVEAFRRAYRDRGQYIGDPAFVDIPVEMLTSPLYAQGQRASINLERATPSVMLPGRVPEAGKGTETTHFSLIDADGNRVAATLSLNFWFGSGFMAPGTGVLLNNEMDDFSIKTGVADGYGLVGGTDANAIGPGRRMVSSMSPTFLESERGVAILGTPGGSRIISMVARASLAWQQGATASEMVEMPRFHHQFLPDEIYFEPGALPPLLQEELRAMGHRLREAQGQFGNMQVVTWDFDDDIVEAASDPRGVGDVIVY